MSEDLLRLEGATLGYPRTPVLEEVELRLQPARVTTIVGPNGSGKSTLLRTLLGVLPVRAGRIWRREGLRIGYVPQQARLDPVYPWTVGEVVAQGLARGPGRPRRPGSAGLARVAEALDRVNLAELASRRFGRLSGGQRQRVLFARATVLPVDLLLLDEPTAGVDREAEAVLLERLAAEARAGTAVVVVTHHHEAWEQLADAWCQVRGGRLTGTEVPL